jgi:hypothetical protein
MTTPMGDLPDWQTFTAPAILPFSVSDIQASQNPVILQTGTPFRVWGLWLRMSMATNAAYVAAILEVKCQIQDGNGNVLLEVACHITAANQTVHAELAIPVPGFTPALQAGTYQVSLLTGASAANVFFRASAGVYYSQP